MRASKIEYCDFLLITSTVFMYLIHSLELTSELCKMLHYYSAILLFYYTIEQLRTFSFSFLARTSFILSLTNSGAI